MNKYNKFENITDLQVICMKICAVFILISAMIGGCSYLNRSLGLEQDNEAEQAIERVIEIHLSLPAGSLDLTPESPEN